MQKVGFKRKEGLRGVAQKVFTLKTANVGLIPNAVRSDLWAQTGVYPEHCLCAPKQKWIHKKNKDEMKVAIRKTYQATLYLIQWNLGSISPV